MTLHINWKKRGVTRTKACFISKAVEEIRTVDIGDIPNSINISTWPRIRCGICEE